MKYGWLYLVAIMDWMSRYVVSWKLSPTLEVDFCIRALEKALAIGIPEIFILIKVLSSPVWPF